MAIVRHQQDVQNRILRQLGADSFQELLPHMEPVELTTRDVLHHSREIPSHIYFPDGGVISFAYDLPSGRKVDFGLIGREGLSSFSILRQHRASPVRTIVPVGGFCAYRVACEPMQQAFQKHEDLRTAVYDFLYLFMGQLAYTAMSNGAHTVTERIARWLLLCDDRLAGEPIPVTHEFFAEALTTQRTTITAQLHVIEGEGAVRNTRGVVEVLDRWLLEQIAGEAYLRFEDRDKTDDREMRSVAGARTIPSRRPRSVVTA